MVICFLVGLVLFLAAVTVMLGLIWLLGLPVYRMNNGKWPRQTKCFCHDEIFFGGAMAAVVLAAILTLIYPLMLLLGDLGCWVLRMARG